MPVDRTIEKVQLFLSGTTLAKTNMLNKPDAFAVLYFEDIMTKTLKPVLTTEVVMDSFDPSWTTTITVDYLFETVQEGYVKVYQIHSGHAIADHDKHALIGETGRFKMSSLMRANGQVLHLDLSQHGGVVNVRGEALTNTRDVFCATFSGNKLANKDGFFGTSDPFLQISRLSEDGSWTVVWKNNKIDNTLSPKWGEAKIPLSTLCNADLDRPLRLEILDWDSNGKHQSMGIAETSVRSMLALNGGGINVIEAAKKGKSGYTNSGTLHANNCTIEHHPTFSDFINGGCEISLAVAIDFTGSNGDPTTPQSLHYLDAAGVTINHYQEAIRAVGHILEQYDTDKTYPVFGFGARVKGSDGEYMAVQHCFRLQVDGETEVKGIDGVEKVYKAAVNDVILSGPTLFTPLIGATTNIATSQFSPSNQKYTVLLILTDGTINDMDTTKQAIINSSHAPMSIIIIGIGSADFSEMKDLDSDGKLLQYGGQTAARDITQFVVYNQTAARGSSVLAQQVLAEIPDQLLSYMEKHNVQPGPKKR